MITLKEIVGKVIIKTSNKAISIDEAIASTLNYDPYVYYHSYRDAYQKSDTYMSYRFDVSELSEFCRDANKVNQMVKDNSLIPYYIEYDDIEALLAKKRAYTLANYNELNNYYRLYLGLPPLSYTEEKGVYEEPDQIFYNDVAISGVDISKPIHKYTPTERSLFSISGELENLIKKNPDVGYLKYLDKNIDIITMRDAQEFGIMWYDRSDDKIVRFVDYYRAIRNQFMTNHYSVFDAATFEFYESIICVHLIMASMADFNADIPLEKLNSSSIDEKDIYLLFQSFGVPKFDFSYKYLNEIATRINSLAMKKGSKQGLNLISKMFDEISIFKYFLIKKLKENGNTNLDGLSNEQKYELFFVKTPLDVDDPYVYMQDENNLIDYRTVVDRDPKWGIGNDKLESELKNRNFSWTESKYLSLDNKINISKFSLEIAHFYRYVISHKTILENLRMYLDTVDINADLFELIIYLQCLIFKKYNVSPDIPDSLSSVIFMYSINSRLDIERLKLVFKEHFKYHDTPQSIDGFLALLENREYTMTNIMDTFEINFEIVEYLYDLRRSTRNYEDYQMIDNIIKAISYGEKVPELFNNKDNLEDFLSEYSSDSTKYIIRLNELAQDVDPKGSINNEITVVINLLKDQVDAIRHKRLLNLFENTQSLYSDLDIVNYLEKIIDFYKSYTQDIIDKGIVYNVDDVTDGLSVLESLKFIFNFNVHELFLASLLFTNNTNEFITILIEKFKLRDVHQSTEILSIIEQGVNQKIIAYSGLNYTI